MTSSGRKGVRIEVDGTCGNGHYLEAVAPTGRTTLAMHCTTEGCGLPVTLRRKARTDRKGDVVETNAPGGTRVKIVRSYGRGGRSAARRVPADEPAPAGEPAGGGARVGPVGGAPAPRVEGEGGSVPGAGDGRPAARRLARGSRPDHRDHEVIPGIF